MITNKKQMSGETFILWGELLKKEIRDFFKEFTWEKLDKKKKKKQKSRKKYL